MQGRHGCFQTSNPNKTLKGPAQQNTRTKQRTELSNKTSKQNIPVRHPEGRTYAVLTMQMKHPKVLMHPSNKTFEQTHIGWKRPNETAEQNTSQRQPNKTKHRTITKRLRTKQKVQNTSPNVVKPERPNTPNTEQRSRTPEHCFVRVLVALTLLKFELLNIIDRVVAEQLQMCVTEKQTAMERLVVAALNS